MKKIMIVCAITALLIGAHEANAWFCFGGSPEPVMPPSEPVITNIYWTDNFRAIQYKKTITELPVSIKKQVQGASQASIDENTSACFYLLDKDNYPAVKLLLQELLQRKPNLKTDSIHAEYFTKSLGNPWFVLLDIDPQFFHHLQDFGFKDEAEFTALTGIQWPNLFARLGWEFFGIK